MKLATWTDFSKIFEIFEILMHRMRYLGPEPSLPHLGVVFIHLGLTKNEQLDPSINFLNGGNFRWVLLQWSALHQSAETTRETLCWLPVNKITQSPKTQRKFPPSQNCRQRLFCAPKASIRGILTDLKCGNVNSSARYRLGTLIFSQFSSIHPWIHLQPSRDTGQGFWEKSWKFWFWGKISPVPKLSTWVDLCTKSEC